MGQLEQSMRGIIEAWALIERLDLMCTNEIAQLAGVPRLPWGPNHWARYDRLFRVKLHAKSRLLRRLVKAHPDPAKRMLLYSR